MSSPGEPLLTARNRLVGTPAVERGWRASAEFAIGPALDKQQTSSFGDNQKTIQLFTAAECDRAESARLQNVRAA
jgi:hypothetical protein